MTRPFRIDSSYRPAGDQPEAIAALIEGLSDGLAQQTLLGVTGSGKTFTIANVIEAVHGRRSSWRPTRRSRPSSTARCATSSRENAVEYFVSYYDYYQPEAYVPASDTYIEKDATHQRAHRADAPVRDQGPAGAAGHASSSPPSRRSTAWAIRSDYHDMVLHLERGDEGRSARRILRGWPRCNTSATTSSCTRGTLPGARRGDRHVPRRVGAEALRVELFDDEIESLAYFDPLTGETLRGCARLTVYPASPTT